MSVEPAGTATMSELYWPGPLRMFDTPCDTSWRTCAWLCALRFELQTNIAMQTNPTNPDRFILLAFSLPLGYDMIWNVETTS